MKTKMFITLIWVLFWGKLLVVAFAITARIHDWILKPDLVILLFVLTGIILILTFIDIYSNDFEKKNRWLLALVLIPSVTPIVYLINRNRLLDIREHEPLIIS